MTNRTQLVWLLASFLFGVVLAVPVFQVGLVDDAYIHARIVEIFLETGQPSFNVGETFKASSSTGFILLLAAMGTVFDTIFAMRLLEAVVIVAIFVLGGQLALHCNRNRLFAVFALFSAAPLVLLAAYGAMETPILVALMLGAALALCRDRVGLALFLIAISVWFRIEAVLLLLLLAIWALKREKSLAILIHIWPVIVLFALELALFGGIIPHAAGAKSLAYGHSYEDSIKMALRFATGETWIGVLLFGLLVTRLVGVIKSRDFNGYADVFFGFAGGVLCAWMIGRSNLFTWYYPLVLAPFVIGIVTMPKSSAGRVFNGTTIVVLAAYLIIGGQTFLHKAGFIGTSANHRVEKYLEIGEALYDECPHCTLATSEIGGLGYSFRGVVYDGFGLADPVALQFHPMPVPEQRRSEGIGAIPPEYISLRNPDYVVSMPIFSVAAQASGVLSSYHKYNCLFAPDGSITVFDNTGVEVFSKDPLTSKTLQELDCTGPEN